MQTIDLRQEGEYDLIINKGRKLDAVLSIKYLYVNEYYDFSLSGYTGCTFYVKTTYDTKDILFSMDLDNGISFVENNKIRLQRTSEQLRLLKAGKYVYNIYLVDTQTNKRALMSGNLVVKDSI